MRSHEQFLRTIGEAYPTGKAPDAVALANIVSICLRRHDAEIARLEAENRQLREYYEASEQRCEPFDHAAMMQRAKRFHAARQALQQQGEGR